MSVEIGLSVVIPVVDRVDDVAVVHLAYKEGLERLSQPYEVIYVVDATLDVAVNAIRKLQLTDPTIRMCTLARGFGESAALTLGCGRARSQTILSLPPYVQVDPGAIPALVEGLDGRDMVVARRYPRLDGALNLFQSRAFHFILRRVLECPFNDLGCSVRVFRRRVIDEVSIYADQHRFLPLIARQQGFNVSEVNAPQDKRDLFRRLYRPGTYVRRLLDILSVYFLLKFVQKPLRFFGLIGGLLLAVGVGILVYLAFDRLILDNAIGDRPLVLLGTLLLVLGFQIVSVGLIGELIFFVNAKRSPHGSARVVYVTKGGRRSDDETEGQRENEAVSVGR